MTVRSGERTARRVTRHPVEKGIVRRMTITFAFPTSKRVTPVGSSRRRGDGRFAARALILLSVLGAAACSAPGNLQPLPPPPASYLLGAGDTLRILTYNDPQLSNSFTVSDAGTIGFPLVGPVKAAGKTPDQLAADLSGVLGQRGVLNHPSVSVEIAQYRPIFVLGEVAKPGQYPYSPGMTMQSAVALAGGYTYRAVTDMAGAVRTEGMQGGRPVTGSVKPASLLAPGDVVTVYERYF